MTLSRRAALATLLAASFAGAHAGGNSGSGGGKAAAPAPGTVYAATSLVSNGVERTPYVDPNMVNTWGVSFNPAGLVWVTNNRTGTSTLYDGTGAINPLVVNVPPASGTGVGSPTGIVFSGTSDFAVTDGVKTGFSRFIFVSNDGVLSGWAPGVNLLNAIKVSVTPGANYMGLGIAASPTGVRLYAADYAQGRVDQFDSQFRKVTPIAGAFVDPALPKGLVPFNVQALAGNVYVTFVKPDGKFGKLGGPQPNGSGGTSGSGGKQPDSVVAVFDTEGRFLRRLADAGQKQPWGLAIAPAAGFGVLSGRVLVADFSDGTISAFDAARGTFVGTVNGADGKPVKVPGLWGMEFGNGVNNQPKTTLFVAAGPNGMGGGVYARIDLQP